jgi:hypothetical protein
MTAGARGRVRGALAGLAGLAALALAAHGAGAQALGDDFEKQEWQEQVTHLPPYPVADKLIRTQVGMLGGFAYFVDADSLDLGTDGIVRVTIVARSPGGAENVTFEGYHCTERQRKIYAVGRSDRTWAQVRNPSWRLITGSQRDPAIADLNDHYFCPTGQPLLRKADTLKDLKEGLGEGMKYPAGAGGASQ